MSPTYGDIMILARPLKETWPFAKAALEQICDKQGHPLSLVNDLHQLCKAKKTYLYICSESETFAIVQSKIDSETGVVSMFVWAAWNKGASTIVTKQGNAYLDELARGMGATEIRCHSRRKGLERTGWTIEDIIYSRPVGEA